MAADATHEQTLVGSSPSQPGLESVLRLDLRLAQQLSRDEQLKQCIDHLEHPSVIVHEIRSAIETTAQLLTRRAASRQARSDDDEPEELLLTHFPVGRDIELTATATDAFRCLASEVVVLPGTAPSEAFDGIDYVGQLCSEKQVIVLGTCESACDASPYLLLLRALNGLVELSLAFRHEQLPTAVSDEFEEAVCFDLHLVLPEPTQQADPLVSLTRDLAENVKNALQQHCPDLGLRDIHLLRMDVSDFSGRLDGEWTV